MAATRSTSLQPTACCQATPLRSYRLAKPLSGSLSPTPSRNEITPSSAPSSTPSTVQRWWRRLSAACTLMSLSTPCIRHLCRRRWPSLESAGLGHAQSPVETQTLWLRRSIVVLLASGSIFTLKFAPFSLTSSALSFTKDLICRHAHVAVPAREF